MMDKLKFQESVQGTFRGLALSRGRDGELAPVSFKGKHVPRSLL